jgi:hypothetical protein
MGSSTEDMINSARSGRYWRYTGAKLNPISSPSTTRGRTKIHMELVPLKLNASGLELVYFLLPYPSGSSYFSNLMSHSVLVDPGASFPWISA